MQRIKKKWEKGSLRFLSVFTKKEKFENGSVLHSEKASNAFCPHDAAGKFENATITGHFGFVLEENSVWEIP